MTDAAPDPGGEPAEGGPRAVVPAGGDRAAATVAILGFSFAMGTGALVLPLLALASGYDAASVGFLTAVAALSQFGFRLLLPWLLGRYPDRGLIVASAVLIALSYLMLMTTQALPVFVVAQLLQGSARSLFWTASQTHAIRAGGTAVRSLAGVSVVSSVGSIAGPIVAGVLVTSSLELALFVGALGGILAAGVSARLHRLDPYDRPKRAGRPRVWRRPGVDVACWAGFTAGGWRAMLASYVPVILQGAGLPPVIIGSLMALADGSAIASSTALLVHPSHHVRRAIDVGVIAVAASLASLPFGAHHAVLAGALIMVGGAGSGILVTLGPALASESVEPGEQGDAISASGTFRAVGSLVMPAGVAAALSVVALPIAFTVAGIGLGLPALIASLGRRRRVVGGQASRP